MERYSYGELVTDTVTGYIGSVTGCAHYYGRKPSQYLVEGLGASGLTAEWLDEGRLDRVKKKRDVPEATAVHICGD